MICGLSPIDRESGLFNRLFTPRSGCFLEGLAWCWQSQTVLDLALVRKVPINPEDQQAIECIRREDKDWDELKPHRLSQQIILVVYDV